MIDGIVNSLNQRIKEGINGSQEKVVETVVATLVQTEVDKRAKLIAEGLSKLRELDVNVLRIKPDQVVYDAAGVQTSAGYSKGKLEERKKAVEQYEQFEKALIAAIDKADFQKLEEKLRNKKGEDKPTEG